MVVYVFSSNFHKQKQFVVYKIVQRLKLLPVTFIQWLGTVKIL